jgi:plastocyanin
MTEDLTFDPATIVVETGATITFTNDSAQLHTATAYEEDVPEDAFFTSGDAASETAARGEVAGELVSPGDSFEITLEEPGTYRYFCIPHESQGMTGTIEVG